MNKNEPIAGYTIRERIGAGGYGEVWRAEAPGGLEKAVKFVYGHLDETRAACELKALSRIKEARHPFLLSLERVEVIDGQLIIITELAERSLKDRFDECRAGGAAGIPRDELLRYLADAADALDYLREHYSLQHLDIKPENLLLLGNHVKVADFGLVKDLKHTNISLVEGLTPVYAPPEAFDDTISSASDQYSLAIVYQEMLSGVLPFPGRTAAQLASQHRYSKPQLGAIPEADRPVIARALAKDPADRFPSCLALVEALLGDTGRSGRARQPEVLPDSANDTTPGSVLATELIGQGNAKRSTRRPQAASEELSPLVLAASPASPKQLPPVSAESGPQLRPTLVLGIGGTAAEVLQRLRFRWQNRFGEVSAVPSLAMLLVDTDRREIHDATRGSDAFALEHRETLLMPLRRPGHYRGESDRLLKWLSRRWLYNIPNSLQTEGLRPLGRLALVDHSKALLERIRTVLQTITSQESLSASAHATGMKIATQDPRVFLVASISGGSGSGMVIDTAYLVRHALQELRLSEAGVCGLLLHGSARRGNDAALGAANACVCLMELEQYCREGYPGDDACGLPAFGRGPTFHDTYVVSVGEDLDGAEHARAADIVAEYLYLNTATNAGPLFDACRGQSSAGLAPDEPGIRYRTFGLSRAGCLHSGLVGRTADRLAYAVLRRWCGEPVASRTARRPGEANGEKTQIEQNIARVTDLCINEFGLGADAILSDMRRLVQDVLGSPPEQFARGVLAPVLARLSERSPQEILAEITASVGPPLGETPPDDFSPATWQWRFSSQAKELALNRAKSIRNDLWKVAEQSDLSAAAVRKIIQRLEDQLNELIKQFPSDARNLEARLGRTIAEKITGKRSRLGWFRGRRDERLVWEAWQTVFGLRLQQTEYWAAERAVRVIRGDLALLRDQLAGLLQELNQVSDQFPASSSGSSAAGSDQPLDWQQAVREHTGREIEERFGELVDRLAAEFARNHLLPRGGLKGLLDGRRDLPCWLPSALRTAARQSTVDAIRKANIVVRLLERVKQDSDALDRLQTQSSPGLATCGGGKRLLAFLPPAADAALRNTVAQAIGEGQVVGLDFDNEFVLCQEYEGMPFGQVAAAICDGNRSYADLTARLHTRIDVVWKRLEVPDGAYALSAF